MRRIVTYFLAACQKPTNCSKAKRRISCDNTKGNRGAGVAEPCKKGLRRAAGRAII